MLTNHLKEIISYRYVLYYENQTLSFIAIIINKRPNSLASGEALFAENSPSLVVNYRDRISRMNVNSPERVLDCVQRPKVRLKTQ